MYLLEVHSGLFEESLRIEPRHHGGWRLITPCEEDLPKKFRNGVPEAYSLGDIAEICPLLYESDEFSDQNFDVFRNLLSKMLKVAESGHDWQRAMTDDVHDAGTVTIQRSSGRQEVYTIIQFGLKKTLVRVHAITTAAGRRVAFISHAFEKPGNSKKTPPSEQQRVKRNLEAYLEALDSGTAQMIDIQGGRDGFLKLI